MMRALKRLIPPLLLAAAAAVVLFTLLGDHKSDYGRVPVPPGGTVELPEETVTVYFEEAGPASEGVLAAPLSIRVTPAAGGSAIELEPTANGGTSETLVQPSENLNALGSVAKLDVPADGPYRISGGSAALAGSSLTFGTDPLTAVARRWELLAILLGAAVLVALIPLPRRGGGHAAEATGWSSDPRSPYA
jgi:hypothetical protein